MQQNASDKVLMLLIQLAAIIAFLHTEVASAQVIQLAASEPATIYYTTSGAEPVSQPLAVSASALPETISLAPNAGRGTGYVAHQKQKFYDSANEFEKYVFQKHGNRFTVEAFDVKQTANGLEGSISIVENRDTNSVQLGDTCTGNERERRIAIAREFMVNNPELIGFTANEETRVRSGGNLNCENLYFDRFVNGYELIGSTFRFEFVPQSNYRMVVNVRQITPQMYAVAQQKALSEEEAAAIVYRDMNNTVSQGSTTGDTAPLPNLKSRKYLRQRAPYVVWEVGGPHGYYVNALTGEIIWKAKPGSY